MYGVMSGVRCSIRKRWAGGVGSVGGRMPRITDWIQKEERGCGGDEPLIYNLFITPLNKVAHLWFPAKNAWDKLPRDLLSFFLLTCIYHWKYHWGGKADEWKGRQVVNNYNRGRCGALIVGRGCREPSQRQPAAASGTATNVVNGYI